MDNFNDDIRKKLENFEASPQKDSFAAIQAKMNKKNAKKAAFIVLPWMKYASAASIAFLFGMAAMHYFTPEQQVSFVAENYHNEVKTIPLFADEDCSEINLFSTITSEVKVVTKNSNIKVASLTQNLNTSSTNILNSFDEDNFEYDSEKQKVVMHPTGTYASNTLISKNNLNTYNLFQLAEDAANHEIVKIDDVPTFTRTMSPTNGIGYQGFWFGPQISFESKFIVNNAFLGSGFGLDIGNDFSSRFGIQTGIRYTSLFKHFDVMDEEGFIQKEAVNYSALTVPFSIRLKKTYFASNIQRPVSFNTYFGGDYSRLGAIKKNQVGGHIGAEFDLFLNPELTFTLGLRAGVNSIMNYQATQEYLTNNKVNYSVGVYTAIRFIAPRKKK